LNNNRKVVVFGAGATGRGHVGLLAWQAGAEVVFVDIDGGLVRALQQAGAYRVKKRGPTLIDLQHAFCFISAKA
jgi:3-hydroxyacyl-CoA dehydrogenase